MRPFAGSLRTDGVACCVLLKRTESAGQPRMGSCRQNSGLALPPGVHVVALDPGPFAPVWGITRATEDTPEQVLKVSGAAFWQAVAY